MRAVTVFTLCILAGSVLAKPKLKVKDLTDYNGVKIVKDKAKITMGSKQDIRIYRNGPRQLVVDSDAVANGDLQVLGKMTSNDLNVLGNFMINGKDLQAIIKAAVDKAVAPLKKMLKDGPAADPVLKGLVSYFSFDDKDSPYKSTINPTLKWKNMGASVQSAKVTNGGGVPTGKMCSKWRLVSNHVGGGLVKVNPNVGTQPSPVGLYRIQTKNGDKTLYVYDKGGWTKGCTYCWNTKNFNKKETYPLCSTDGGAWKNGFDVSDKRSLVGSHSVSSGWILLHNGATYPGKGSRKHPCPVAGHHTKGQGGLTQIYACDKVNEPKDGGDGPVGKYWRRGSPSANAGAKVSVGLPSETTTGTVSFWYRENDFQCHRVKDCAGVLWLSSNFVKQHGAWQNTIARGVSGTNQDISWWSAAKPGENIGFKMKKNAWVHITLTTTNGGKDSKIYVNGMLKKQRKSGFSGAQGGGAFELGPDYYIMHYYSLSGKNGNRHYARGDIDELATWNRALSPNEVTKIYRAQSKGKPLTAFANFRTVCTPCPPAKIESKPCTAAADRVCVDDPLADGLVSYYTFDGDEPYVSTVNPKDKFMNIGSSKNGAKVTNGAKSVARPTGKQCLKWRLVSNHVGGGLVKVNPKVGTQPSPVGLYRIQTKNGDKTLYVYDKGGWTKGCTYCWNTKNYKTKETYPLCSTDGGAWKNGFDVSDKRSLVGSHSVSSGWILLHNGATYPGKGSRKHPCPVTGHHTKGAGGLTQIYACDAVKKEGGDGPVGKYWRRGPASASGGALVDAGILRTRTATVSFWYRENDFTCHRVNDCAGVLWFSTNFVKEHASWGNMIGRGAAGTNQDLSWWCGSPSYGCKNVGHKMAKNKWVHITLTSENGVKNKMYIDGKLKSTQTKPFTKLKNQGGGIYDFGPQYIVMHYQGNSNNHFGRGDIDELATWNRALTGKEVSRLFSRMNDKFHIVGGNAQCTPCPGDETEKTPCTPLKDRTCQPNLFQPLKDTKNWEKNAGDWVQNAKAGSMKNTKPIATWLNAGWTGYWMIEKNLQVTMREVIGVTGRFKSTAVGHPGVLFHYEDKNNWEGFYFRPHSSGKKGAVQHYAIVNGKEKQQDSYKVNFPTNGAWYKVTIKVTKDKWSCTAGGATFTGNRNIKGIPGGVGIMNHESQSEFKDMLVCNGAGCKLS